MMSAPPRTLTPSMFMATPPPWPQSDGPHTMTMEPLSDLARILYAILSSVTTKSSGQIPHGPAGTFRISSVPRHRGRIQFWCPREDTWCCGSKQIIQVNYPATPLFAQEHIQADNKESTKASHYGPNVRGNLPVVHRAKCQWCGKCLHVMILSWYNYLSLSHPFIIAHSPSPPS